MAHGEPGGSGYADTLHQWQSVSRSKRSVNNPCGSQCLRVRHHLAPKRAPCEGICEDDQQARERFHAVRRCADLAATGHSHRPQNTGKNIYTTQEMIICRAGELRVSLIIRDDYDEALDTRALRCSDTLIDPLLQKLKQVHSDRQPK